MAVSIGSYDKVNLLAGSGITSGVKVAQAPLAKVVGNHNFMRANYCPAVAYGWTSRGFSFPVIGSAGSFFDVFAAEVGQERDARGLTVQVIYSTTAAGSLRVNTQLFSTTEAVADSSGSIETIAIDVATPSSGDFIVKLQAATDSSDADEITIYGWTVRWQRITALTVTPDTADASGWTWAQSADVATTEPLSVEHVNRLRGGPRTLFDSVPNVFFSAQTSLTILESAWETDSTSDQLIMRQLVKFRRPKASVMFRAHLMGAPGTAVRISIVGGSSVSIVAGYDLTAGEPTNPLSIAALTFTESAEIYVGDHFSEMWIEVYMKAGTAGEGARLYSLTGELV